MVRVVTEVSMKRAGYTYSPPYNYFEAAAVKENGAKIQLKETGC